MLLPSCLAISRYVLRKMGRGDVLGVIDLAGVISIQNTFYTHKRTPATVMSYAAFALRDFVSGNQTSLVQNFVRDLFRRAWDCIE